MTTYFPTWPVDGPLPLPPVHGLVAAATAPAAGVRIVVDTAVGPHDENDVAPEQAGLESGLVRRPDGTIVLRVPAPSAPGGFEEEVVWLPDNAGRERWLNGVAVWGYPSNVPETWDACSGSAGAEKDFGEQPAVAELAAVTLSEAITCTSQQVPDQAAFRARAVAVLAATESYAVARSLLTGSGIVGQPYLADSSCDVPNGDAATKPNHGIQVLEEQIGLTGRLGLIHCSPMLATALLGQGFAIKDVTGVIRTINGNVVIPDFGYTDGQAPTGHPDAGATEEWAYATGPIDLRRSEIFTTPDTREQALDRGELAAATTGRSNTFTYRAERFYAIACDFALHAAVLVDRCSTDCVVGS